jgi:alpha-beta hydrolase superfamily lysophospholipase
VRAFGKFVGRVLFASIVVCIGLWYFGPYEDASFDAAFDETQLDGGVQAYLDAREAQVPDIRANSHKRVIWAGAAETKTPVSVVYLHGFSASSEEIRPVPDDVAAALGANLVFTRFKGHGRDSDGMADSSASAWMDDTVEALAVARRVGEKVLVIATSTGGTLAARALHEPALQKDVAGVVFVSPNFAVNNAAAPLLSLPAARYWLPLLLGENRSFEPMNEAQARHWTTKYPSVAVFPMAATVKAAGALDYASVKIPAMFHYAENDSVVRADVTQRVAAQWGGPIVTVRPTLAEGEAPSAHVIAGDITAPSQTPRSVAAILDWFEGL